MINEKWNATHYLKFSVERTRAASDLAARIEVENPKFIVDLGWGPGNSTQVLRQRWPEAKIIGIDNSAEMIVAAQQAFPVQTWMLADLGSWQPDHAIDVVYSNAALQWLPDHALLIRRLFSFVADNGALAFQIPSSNYTTLRTLIHEISYQSNWTQKLISARRALTMECPAFYYDTLCSEASRVDLWETEYNHILATTDSIVDWISSTGLRPFLIDLESAAERQQFLAELRERVAAAYEKRTDGKVLFSFRRTFVIAYR